MNPSLLEIRSEAADCRRCPLWKLGTQTVFGEGAAKGLMLVGEQPDDKPSWSEIDACSHWLGRVGQLRGQVLELDTGHPTLVTIHPSAVLRAGESRALRRAELLEDLEVARETLAEVLGQTSKIAKS